MIRLLLVVLLAIPALARADELPDLGSGLKVRECNFNCKAPWSKTDIALQTTVTGLQIMDWAQTRWFIKHPYYQGRTRPAQETNPFLGSSPSVGKVDNFIFASIVGHLVISNLLPSDYRSAWQLIWIGLEADAVHSNKSLGVKFSWGFK